MRPQGVRCIQLVGAKRRARLRSRHGPKMARAWPNIAQDGGSGVKQHFLGGQTTTFQRVIFFEVKQHFPNLVWSFGPLVLWSAGPLVLWIAGPLVRWTAGPLVRWSSGPLGRWSEGDLLRGGGWAAHRGARGGGRLRKEGLRERSFVGSLRGRCQLHGGRWPGAPA